MRNVTVSSRGKFGLILTAACLCLLAGWAVGAESTENPKDSWPSFRNGLQQQGVAGTKFPDKLQLLWAHKVDDPVTATAAIVKGKVYVGTLGGNVLCFNLKDGRLLWKYRSIESNDPEEFAPGFNAAATVAGDSVYIGDEDGVFHAINRETGELRWKVETQGEIVGGAAVVGPHVLVGSHDGSLYCFKTADGERVWEIHTEQPVNCSVAVVENFTFSTGCDGILRVIDINTGEENQALQLRIGSYVIASPAIMGEMLYVGNHDAQFMAINWKQNKIEWTYKAERRHFPYHSSAAVTDELVVVGNGDKRLHCLDRKTGEERWMFTTKGAVDGSPVIAGDRVFFGSADGKFYGVTLADGKRVFRHIDGRSFTASPAVAEGRLVIGSESGKIYCFGGK